MPSFARHVFLLFALIAAQAVAGETRPLLGVIEIPALFGEHETPPAEPVLALYASPGDEEPVRIIKSPDRLEHAEYGYELAGAKVYGRTAEHWLVFDEGADNINGEQHGEWLWIRNEDAAAFHDYFSLVENSAYMTEAWNGKFYRHVPDPLLPEATAKTLDAESKWVMPVEHVTDADGREWFLVIFFRESGCTSESLALRVIDAGYVPAHANDGKPNVWFWSRGC